MKPNNYQIAFSAFLIALAISMGAFGAHILNPGLEAKYIRTLGTANLYFLFHSFGLFTISLYGNINSNRLIRTAYSIMLMGIVLFSGSLYWIVLSKFAGFALPSFVGPLTPIGGLAFIASWLMISIHFLKR